MAFFWASATSTFTWVVEYVKVGLSDTQDQILGCQYELRIRLRNLDFGLFIDDEILFPINGLRRGNRQTLVIDE